MKKYIKTKEVGMLGNKIIKASKNTADGRYFDLIDYFDVWGNEEDGWEVNNQAVVENKIWISDDTTDEELFNYLRDTIEFFSRYAEFSDVIVEWDDPYFIEIFRAEDMMPLCSLRAR